MRSANMSVSVGFAAHVVDVAGLAGITLSQSGFRRRTCRSACRTCGQDIYPPGWHAGFNIPAFLIVLLLTVVLVRGIRESARTNNIMVLVKIAAILTFVFFGLSFIHPANYHPFSPNGWSGVLAGGSIIFFTYIGFDAVSTASRSARTAARCADRHSGDADRLHAVVYRRGGGVDRPGAVADGCGRCRSGGECAEAGLPAAGRAAFALGALAVLIGALVGMISSILVFQLGRRGCGLRCRATGCCRMCSAKYTQSFVRRRLRRGCSLGFLVAIPAGLFDVGTLCRDVEYRDPVCLCAGV
jgi:APA family basic amino acid/polyamine antiporter